MAGALADINVAITLEPTKAGFYQTRAYILLELGQRDLARKDWQKYKELLRDSPDR